MNFNRRSGSGIIVRLKRRMSNIFDPILIGIICLGIFLRLFSFFYSSLTPDSYQYIEAARELLRGTYSSYRPPGFPLIIAPFLWIFQNGTIAIKTACFTASILLIFSSYLVFKKAAYKILENESNANYVGLIVSYLISIQYFLIFNNGRGLREDIISLCLVLLFYFVIVKSKKNKITENILIVLFMSYLALIHPTAGLFCYISFLIYYIISFFTKLDKNISVLDLFLISVSFISSYLFWLIFCFFKFGDPFYTMHIQSSWFRNVVNLDLTSLEAVINSIFRGLIYGIPREIFLLFLHLFIVILISITTSIYYFRKKAQIKFLIIFLGLNFLYLSVFIAVSANIRLLLYFFPFLFYLALLYLTEIIFKSKKRGINFIVGSKSFSFKYYNLFNIYLMVFSIIQITMFFIGIFDLLNIWIFDVQ